MRKTLFLLFLLLPAIPVLAAAEGTGESINIMHQLNRFIFQLAVIIFAARFGSVVFKRLGLPPVTGEIVVGIILGPYLLGSIPFSIFPHGLFGVPPESVFPVSMELFTFVMVASILHLFVAGLETDVRLFLRFSSTGFLVGISGALLAFFAGSLTGMLLLDIPFLSPENVFLGIMGSVTSVGITTRILSDHRKLDSPVGITILESTVIDDILGIILLTIALGFFHSPAAAGGPMTWSGVGLMVGRAVLVGAAFIVGGMIFSKHIAAFLKRFKNKSVFSIFAFAIALFTAALFEEIGLVAIVGAYLLGLILSKTDLHYVLKENLDSLNNFMLPIFFTSMGMLINIRIFSNSSILIFGLIYSAGCIFSKFIGGSVPARLLKFNRLGALQVGLGMIPRGEMVFVLAGTWLYYGVIGEDIFGVVMIMTFITTIIGPPLFSQSLKNRSEGRPPAEVPGDKISLTYQYPSEEITRIFVEKIIENFKTDGFFVYTMKLDTDIYRINKNNIVISLFANEQSLDFKLDESELGLVKVVMYESYRQIVDAFSKLSEVEKPDELISQNGEIDNKNQLKLGKLLNTKDIITNLKGRDKQEVILELIDRLDQNEALADKALVAEDVLARENSMSTGLGNSLAIPHARTKGVDRIRIAVGLKRSGIDFQAPDMAESKLIILILAPKNMSSDYLEVLSSIAGYVASKDDVERFLNVHKPEDIYKIFAS